jgi:hypothetical protein
MKRDYMECLTLHVLLTGSYKVIQSYSIKDLASENCMLIESELNVIIYRYYIDSCLTSYTVPFRVHEDNYLVVVRRRTLYG